MTSITAPGATDSSLDPDAGGTYRDKPIWDVTTIEQNMNRTGYDWYTNNYNELDDGVLNFGFWKNIEELQNSYYTNETGSIAFNEAYYSSDFSAFNAGQIAVARTAIGLWNDLIDITFKETKSGDADITYGNTYTGGAQAYAYLPFGSTIDQYYYDNFDFSQAGRLGGDVWIDGFVASNFFPLGNSYYATTTMIHETGHALGLSHPGDYNAIGPDGEVLSPTYENQAEYAQDSLQYSIMSYFDGYETGAQFIDFQLLNFAYPSTPMIHDIASIQAIYGADYTTRAGDTVYGFNSTEVGTAYDFTSNTRPVLSIWDGGGNDTLDLSGFKTPSTIDLNPGAFSSAGGADHFYTLDEINEARAKLGFAARTQATYDYYQDLIKQLGITSPLFKDNISIAYGATIENAIGGLGDDKIIANTAANMLNGKGGYDTVSYETATSGVQISLKVGAVGAGGAAGDTLKFIEGVIGSDYNDTIKGSFADNTIAGGRGDDVMSGRGGADTYVFRTAGLSTGHDTIIDFSGDDVIAVTKQLAAGDNGIVALGAKNTIVLDATDGDSVRFFGHGADAGLRLVGQANGFYYYAAADNSSLTQDSIAKLHAPAETLAEAAAKTAAQIAASNGPANVDLANRADGWTSASTDHASTSNGVFADHVAYGAGAGAAAGSLAGELGSTFHGTGAAALHALSAVELV